MLTTKHKETLTPITDAKFLEFLATKQKSTRTTYEAYFRRLIEYDLSINGVQMLKDRKQWEKRIFAFRNYLIEEKGYSNNYVESCLGAVRGFFGHFRKSLDLTNPEKRLLAKRGRVTEDFRFDLPILKKLWDVANLKEKWVLCNKSFGLRAEDFSRITFGQLRSLDLTQEAPIFLGELNTEKESVRAFTYCDSDVISVIRSILEINADKPDNAEVWTANSQELSYAVQSLARKAHVENGNKIVRFHCLRKFLIDALSSHMSESKWKQIVGKAISEGAYISSDNLRECFKRTLKDIVFNYTNGNGAKKDEEIRKLNEKIELLTQLLLEKAKPEKDSKDVTEGLTPNAYQDKDKIQMLMKQLQEVQQ